MGLDLDKLMDFVHRFVGDLGAAGLGRLLSARFDRPRAVSGLVETGFSIPSPRTAGFPPGPFLP